MELQYKIECSLAGMIDTSSPETPLRSRLDTLKAYRRARTALSWKNAQLNIPYKSDAEGIAIFVFGPVCCLLSDGTVRFIQPECPLRGITRQEWTVDILEIELEDLVYDHSQRLLVLVERMPGCVFYTNVCGNYLSNNRPGYNWRIHLRSSDTGYPHPLAAQSSIDFLETDMGGLVPDDLGEDIEVEVKQYAAMVAALFTGRHDYIITRLRVWNWKTGEELYVSSVVPSIKLICFSMDIDEPSLASIRRVRHLQPVWELRFPG